MNRKVWKAFIVLTGVVLLIPMLASYGASAPPTPKKGGILKISCRTEPPTLNCMMNPSVLVFAWTTPVFNGLVMLDPTQEEVSVEKVVPSLAEKWTISPDGKIYTFYLRKGVKFHDGRPFTAKDVKYSLEFFADLKMSSLAPMVVMMEKVEIVDDYTVKVSLKYPHVPFLLYLSNPYCVMLPAHLAKVSPKSTDFLIGTGPFKFKEQIPGKVWIYERNPDYFIKGLPYLDGLEIYKMAWPVGVDAFCAGRLHMAGNLRYGIDQKPSVDKLKKYAAEATIKLKPVGVLRGVMFNVAGLKGRKGPWQDVRVRRAMAMVTDFPGSMIAGQGSLDLGENSGVVPPYVPTGLSWKEVEKVLGIDKPMEQRIKEAKRLMKEAGYPDGFKAELICRNQDTYVRPAEFMVEGWRKNLNIEVAMKPLETPVLFPRRDVGDLDLIYEGTTGRYGGAPEETLAMFVSQAAQNYGEWSNADYDKLYDQLIKETDPKKRAEISVKMQKIFLQEVPFIINVVPAVGTAYRPTLHGFVIHPGHTNWSCIDRMWLEK
ncbi:MAG: ABC transporter substrate-binding protein [Proteobacteria bacterium]|nr:ABC transporter substrate-binding protein [Pseudomonadota bacterium]